jgi:hypothetical protein
MKSFRSFSRSTALNRIRVTCSEVQPSAPRTTSPVSHLIPPINRWAIVIRPLRGLVAIALES